MHRILVAIDFSEVTDQVISAAVTLNQALKGRLRILHVDDSAPYSYTPKDDSDPVPVSLSVSEPPDAIAPLEVNRLQGIRDRLAREQLDAEYRLLEGPAADIIISSAKEFGADIIVIGAHEHGKFFHCLFGDTTGSLIRHAPCPILVVPHKAGS
jgi:nucleotide-binding universal stress UspA family protein